MPKNENSRHKIDSKDPKLLDTIARRYTKVVGEDKKIKTLVCCFVSKDLPKQYRTSVIISNQSSTGKSYLLNNVLEPFRNPTNKLLDPVIDYTDFTEAHFKRSQSNVNGKIIKLEQLERRDEKGLLSFQRLKPLLSEGRIKFGIADKNEKGQHQAKDFEIVGVPVIVTTTTEFDIDQETANRFLMMQLDESENQTEKIIDYTLSKYSQLNVGNTHDQQVEELRKFFSQLKKAGQHIDSIIIPFADKIKSIIPKTLEMRRDLSKILNLTCIIAFIHCRNRDNFIDKSGKHYFTGDLANTKKEYTYHVIARVDDLIEALDIAGDTIKQTINKSSKKLMEIHALLKKKFNEKALQDNQGVTVKEVTKESGLSETRTREYLNELCYKGFAGKDDAERINRYYPENKKFSELNASNIIFTPKEYEEWVKTVQDKHSDRFFFVSSCRDEKSSDLTDLSTKKENSVKNTARSPVSC